MAKNPPVLDYGDSTYEKDFWLGQDRDYEDLAERTALRSLLPPTGGRLAEIGAGFGRLANLYLGHQQVLLLDYSPDLLRDARRHLAPSPPLTVAGNFYRLPFADGACDTVVMVRVLHHAADVPAALRELRRILLPGGTLVLEHANKRHLKALWRYAVRRGPSPLSLEPHEFARLNFAFHPAYVRRHLEATGFRVEAQRAVSTFRLPLLKRLLPAPFLARLDGLLQPALAPLRLSPSLFLRCRAVGEGGRPPSGRPLFRCPNCFSIALDESDPTQLRCTACGATWPIRDGIYHLR